MGGSDELNTGRDGCVAASPKTGLAPQASGNLRLGATALLLAAIALAGCEDHGSESKDCVAPAQTSAISGFCVPRYVSLKRDRVYARRGPAVDYPALWVYRARGLPVQVVAETLDWRRICDPDGPPVWVHRSMVDGRRTVVPIGATNVALYKTPRAEGAVAGVLKARTLASLDRCQGDWCRLKVDGAKVWAQASALWGVAPAAQCR